MTHINLKNLNEVYYIAGSKEVRVTPRKPYDDLAIEFVDSLSKSLRKHSMPLQNVPVDPIVLLRVTRVSP